MITLSNDSVADRWMRLLRDCSGNGVALIDQVERELDLAKLPAVTWTPDTLAGASLKGMLGGRREALIVRNKRFREFQIAIACWGYGTYLQVVRYVVSSSGLAGSLRRKALFDKEQSDRYTPGAELDVLASAELDAWIAATDFSLRTAIDSLLQDDEKTGDPWNLLTFD